MSFKRFKCSDQDLNFVARTSQPSMIAHRKLLCKDIVSHFKIPHSHTKGGFDTLR